jgi:hypothetical protein
MANCRSCGAEIIWTKTEIGKNMPLSVKSKETRFWINDEGQAVAMTVYLSHFADCPDAAQHRKSRGPNAQG